MRAARLRRCVLAALRHGTCVSFLLLYAPAFVLLLTRAGFVLTSFPLARSRTTSVSVFSVVRTARKIHPQLSLRLVRRCTVVPFVRPLNCMQRNGRRAIAA